MKTIINTFDMSFMDNYGDEFFEDGFHCNRNIYFDMYKFLVSNKIQFDNNFNISDKDKNYALHIILIKSKSIGLKIIF